MATVAQIIITHVKGVTIGGDAIVGVKSASIKINQTVKEGAADGAPGITSQDKTSTEITGTLEFESQTPLVSLLSHAVGNLVITGRKSGLATNRVTTIKNVKFRSTGYGYAGSNENQIGPTKAEFKATWSSSDTLSTMITET